MMPNIGVPGPAVGFLQECLRFWDHWLKGVETGIMSEPKLRAWMQEYVEPAPYYEERPGRWVGVEWPRSGPSRLVLSLTKEGLLAEVSPAADALASDTGSGGAETWISHVGAQRCGETAGVWCANGKGHEMAVDQAPDDALSMTFTTEPLESGLEVLGRPRLSLRIRVDRPLAVISARFEDVAPDGKSLLVGWDLLNLTHRDSHEELRSLEPGEVYDVEIETAVCGHVFAPGHRVRVAVSPTYWPNAWPSPEAVTLEVALGGASTLELPLLGDADAAEVVMPAEGSSPLPDSAPHAERVRDIFFDQATGVHEIKDRQSDGRTIHSTGSRYVEDATDEYSITEGDPLSASVSCERETRSESSEHSWRVTVSAKMTCDAQDFFISETYAAYDSREQVFERTREYRIPRDYV